MARTGRPSIYSDELADEIFQRLRAGESARSICRDPAMPCWHTVWKWRIEKEEFSARYALARRDGADAIFDEMREIADGEGIEQDDKVKVQRARLQVDTRKFMVARMFPASYSEKTEHKLTGDPANPIATSNAHVFTDPDPETRKALTGTVQDLLCGGREE